MKPEFSVVIPYLPTPANDAALELALQSLHDNSNCCLEVIIDDGGEEHPNQFQIWHHRSAEARAENVLVLATDAIPGPDWDLAFLKHLADGAMYSGYTVECGVYGAASDDIARDFGKLPYSFDRPAFENWVKEQMPKHQPEVQTRRWLGTPCAFKRDWFLSIGGLRPEGSGKYLTDVQFYHYHEAKGDTQFLRVNSWFYHFQALSHLKLCGGRGDTSRYEVEQKEEGTKRVQLGVLKQKGSGPLKGAAKFGVIRMEWEKL